MRFCCLHSSQGLGTVYIVDDADCAPVSAGGGLGSVDAAPLGVGGSAVGTDPVVAGPPNGL